MNEKLPKRKDIRLKNYDYSEPGAYFITISIKKQRKIAMGRRNRHTRI